MRKTKQFSVSDIKNIKQNILDYSKDFKYFSILDNNNFRATLKNKKPIEYIAAIGKHKLLTENVKNNFNKLKNYTEKEKDWLFGFLSYDLKNEIENLSSENMDLVKAPLILFFIPKILFIIKSNKLEIRYLTNYYSEKEINNIYKKLTEIKDKKSGKHKIKVNIQHRVAKDKYIKQINLIKKHILKGDIYELNYCMEFYSKNRRIEPHQAYQNLKSVSPTPFSVYCKLKNLNIISASPERFIKKSKEKIFSQPIKGTAKRESNKKEDLDVANALKNNIKERAENIMIVDLVRNDLSKSAETGSVKVEELCKIYSFPQVHQMISTVSCTLGKQSHALDPLINCFPPGSMTGAPKLRAMKLIEKYESTKRGIYAGVVGYITPEMDYDFNVVIRTILYNSENNYLSYMVGSAITALSEPEKEYEECLIKAKAMELALKI